MKNDEYLKLVKSSVKKPPVIKNALRSFLYGGLFGALVQIIYLILLNILKFSDKTIMGIISLGIIFLSSLITSIGKFDELVKIFRFGIIIPTSGFAHSITSSSIDAKREGLITGIGCSFFQLAGSVILYSIVAAFILVIIKVIFFV